MGALTALAVIKGLSKKVIPTIKAFACSECHTIASVSIYKNNIRVTKCNCR